MPGPTPAPGRDKWAELLGFDEAAARRQPNSRRWSPVGPADLELGDEIVLTSHETGRVRSVSFIDNDIGYHIELQDGTAITVGVGEMVMWVRAKGRG